MNTDHLDPAPNAGPARSVVLVHGFLDTGAIFRRIGAMLAEAGWDVHAIDYTPNDGRVGLEAPAAQLGRYIADRIDPAHAPDLIGFSMGGLIARYYVQRLGGIDRIRRLLTLAAPHRGTAWSYLAPLPGLRQMRPGSAFLDDLNSDHERLRDVDFVSLWTPFDLMVVPPNHAVLPDHPHVRIPVAAHPLMLSSAAVLDEILRLLA